MTPDQHDFLKASIERGLAQIAALEQENDQLKFQLHWYERFRDDLKRFLED